MFICFNQNFKTSTILDTLGENLCECRHELALRLLEGVERKGELHVEHHRKLRLQLPSETEHEPHTPAAGMTKAK